MLASIDATHAARVARFQFNPIATAGTIAAAKVPQPKVPSSAAEDPAAYVHRRRRALDGRLP